MATKLEVHQIDTFECVTQYIRLGYHPVALDFASGTNPGGGWRSKQQGTQEEKLCNESDLGLLLEKKKYPIPKDSYHYLPKVIIYKNKLTCGIIASELRSIASRTPEYLIGRIESLYQCAIKQGHDLIILGAWGCGAFKETNEDAEILAKAFKIVSQKYQSQIKSVFAVLSKANYKIFKRVLEA